MSIIYINPYQFATAGVTYDTDAQAYITAVEAADGQALETGVRDAINAFVVNCKADGIWPAIKASCILSGARTLSGALVPLAGAAPTNFNFVSGDYDRKTGLIGNASNKYLNSNRNANADPQSNFHLAVYASAAASSAAFRMYMGGRSAGPGNDMYRDSANFVFRSRTDTPSIIAGTGGSIGLIGHSRNNSTSFTAYINSGSTVLNASAGAADTAPIFVFGRSSSGVLNSPSNPRLAFYSIGESLDLALLDARLTTLINAFAATIP